MIDDLNNSLIDPLFCSFFALLRFRFYYDSLICILGKSPSAGPTVRVPIPGDISSGLRVRSEAMASEQDCVVAATTPSSSAPGSPKNKVKFLCSHGGKILPRPSDGELKYVGGETRIVSIPRDISFSELTKKLASISDLNTIFKYQLLNEELDTLVTVKSDEDLRHMLEEYDRYEAAGSPMLRAFLFPANPVRTQTTHLSPLDPHVLEQRYIEAVNGTLRSPSAGVRQPFLYGNLSPMPLSSASSSPKSPQSLTLEYVNYEPTPLNPYRNSRFPLPKVHSSPSICGVHGHIQSHHHQYGHHHHHHQHHHYQKHPHVVNLHSRAHPPEPLSIPVSSLGSPESWKYQMGPSPRNHICSHQ